MTEINQLLYHSDDRHFFQEQQQLYAKESRQVINKMTEETHEIKRQTNQLSQKLDVLGREQEQLEKREESDS